LPQTSERYHLHGKANGLVDTNRKIDDAVTNGTEAGASDSRCVTSLDGSTREQKIFESSPISSSLVPPRSKLYPLEPIGVGTGFVESLSNFVARLAEAHMVSVGNLVGGVLGTVANPHGKIIGEFAKSRRVNGHGFRVSSYSMNGVSDRAVKWVYALEATTTLTNLRCLTLLPFRGTLPHVLFNPYRSWCSVCFEQWRANGQTVYEPFLWAFQASSFCPVHELPLSHTCRGCGRTLNPLGVFCRPGYCEHCGAWLGTLEPKMDQSENNVGSVEEQIWSSRQVAGLLEMLPWIDPETARESFRQSLIAYLEQITAGNCLALAEHIRCPPSILQKWLDGVTIPQLENLLRTSRCLNVPASSFFTPSKPTPTNIAAAREAIAVAGSRGVSPYRDSGKIRQALLAALDDEVPRSLSDVARCLGYTNTERLYQADRTLCHKIAARYRHSGRSHWWKKPGATRICETSQLKEILEQSLASSGPISVAQIAARLGYSNSGYIQQKFPDLCTAIRKKIAVANQGRRETMRGVLENALHEDPPPTLVDLSCRLGYSSSTVIRMYEHDLCDQLAERHKAHRKKRREDIREAAVAMLTEKPVPSVGDVCKRLGITRFFIGKYFPETRNLVAEQHRLSMSDETTRRREVLFRDVRNIIVDLQSRGLYPTVNKIVDSLPAGSSREWIAIQGAVREARKSLGI
jgi:AraC-like DNA-binding protein